MIELLEKKRILIGFVLVLIVFATIITSPVFLRIISITLVLLSISMAILFIFRKHREHHQQAGCSRDKMIRYLTFDLLGLLFTLVAAIFGGRFAGGFIGLHAGFWFGLLAGFAGGFMAAWGIRAVWGRLVLARV